MCNIYTAFVIVDAIVRYFNESVYLHEPGQIFLFVICGTNYEYFPKQSHPLLNFICSNTEMLKFGLNRS